jgi:hypothetical protein
MIELRETIEHFLASSAEPALSEPGEELIRLSADNFALDASRGGLRLQAWSERRNIVRRITGVNREARGKLVLSIERFGKRPGTLCLLDLSRPIGQDATRTSDRLEFREQFHRFLRRQFPLYRVAELSTEPDLEHSLSPAYPRALLRQGGQCWAAIGASPDACHAERVLTFGLIWLDYLRGRESDLAIRGLVLYLPAGQEKLTCLRLLFLNPNAAQYTVFVYDEEGSEGAVDLGDYGNLSTRLDHCRRRVPGRQDDLLGAIAEGPGVESIALPDGEISFRVRGLEFARTAGTELLFGIHRKRPARHANLREVIALAQRLAELRSPDAVHSLNPLYLANPEAWLESQVRAHIEELDAQLLPHPLYGQVPSFASVDRGVLDLLALDRTGRLAVIELKASQDIHLPLQALDYWLRVQWHAARGDFASNGYFPESQVNNQPPRLLLVSPALDFHPANERVLRFFSPSVPVERLGVGLQWRKELKVMLRS